MSLVQHPMRMYRPPVGDESAHGLPPAKRKIACMTAAGQLVFLPALRPARWALRQYTPSRHGFGALDKQQDRLYRLPPQERGAALTYHANAYMASERITGTFIDLFV